MLLSFLLLLFRIGQPVESPQSTTYVHAKISSVKTLAAATTEMLAPMRFSKYTCSIWIMCIHVAHVFFCIMLCTPHTALTRLRTTRQVKRKDAIYWFIQYNQMLILHRQQLSRFSSQFLRILAVLIFVRLFLNILNISSLFSLFLYVHSWILVCAKKNPLDMFVRTHSSLISN